jgi:hypothetical protein
MKYLLLIATVLILTSCKKNDPENNPEYIGKWLCPKAARDLPCDYVIEISANGYGVYGLYGDYCGEEPIEAGECRIGKNKIKIACEDFKIVTAPLTIATKTVETYSQGTVSTTIVMKLKYNGGYLNKSTGDFYKIE